MKTTEPAYQNRLSRETSPYLLQHAANPVDWYAWGDEAFALARDLDKPILLSIGYSACHWCHVMAHESFENDETAVRMNELFVNIKVDREERPDVDKIYQTAHQLITRRAGGWPLTVFLNPHNRAPIFAGTYFPCTPSHNLPAFNHVLAQVAGYYASRKADLAEGNHALLEALRTLECGALNHGIDDPALLSVAREALLAKFDDECGGFGGAPKFPHVASIELLLRIWQRNGETDGAGLDAALLTLRKMAEGGLYDQLGGGFYRYSVDARWEIPHFEKMLYDNGPLLALFSWAWQISGEILFRDIAHETAAWAIREMRSGEGGFYSSLNADSEGHEGRFYVWDRGEVLTALLPDEFRVVETYFGLDQLPNFEGQWHLRRAVSLPQLADSCGLDMATCSILLTRAKEKLVGVRDRRVRPDLDDKILTSWNALMIKGLAVAGRVFQDHGFVDTAEAAMACIHRHCWRDGRLMASYKAGKARFSGYLDDYAFLLDACLALLEVKWSSQWLDFAESLADCIVEQFIDPENGGFYFTARDHEALIYRPKSLADESMASGAGVAVSGLIKLDALVEKPSYREVAERALATITPQMCRNALGYGSLLLGLETWSQPQQTIILRGDETAFGPWREAAFRHYAPSRLCVAVGMDATGLPPGIRDKTGNAPVTAFICEGTQCLPSIDSLEKFAQYMAGLPGGS